MQSSGLVRGYFERKTYRLVGTGTGSGVPVSREDAILWHLRNGKLFEGEDHLDQTLALEAAGRSDSRFDEKRLSPSLLVEKLVKLVGQRIVLVVVKA
jgi:hypothetical protein